MQLQGADQPLAESLSRGEIPTTGIPVAEIRLLEFAALLTQHAYRNTPETIQELRDVGWTDEQIAEAVYITGYFAFFNRVADAFGLANPYADQRAHPAGPPVVERPRVTGHEEP